MAGQQDLEALAREAGLECIEALKEEVRNSKGANRIAAIKALLSHGSKAAGSARAGGRAAAREGESEGSACGASPAIIQAIAALQDTGAAPKDPADRKNDAK